mmetsp:Transcript_65749/g.130266  ORF Transcript_65749/g.130266 Transcript_65749/m.130266 type:complete len:88 (-) Transcript_65749:9-272(-)
MAHIDTRDDTSYGCLLSSGCRGAALGMFGRSDWSPCGIGMFCLVVERDMLRLAATRMHMRMRCASRSLELATREKGPPASCRPHLSA